MVLEGKRVRQIRELSKPRWRFIPQKIVKVGEGSFNLVNKVSKGLVIKSLKDSLSSYRLSNNTNDSRYMMYAKETKESVDTHLRFLHTFLGDLMFKPRVFIDWSREGDRIYFEVNQIEPNVSVFLDPQTGRQIGSRPCLPNENTLRRLAGEYPSLKHDIDKLYRAWSYFKSMGLSFDITLDHSSCLYVDPRIKQPRLVIFDLIPLVVEDIDLFSSSQDSEIRNKLITTIFYMVNRSRLNGAKRLFDIIEDISTK